jgi:UDP-2-acetamido-2,6-beta-L-arabino-hexul-4-ose reductase
MKTVGITGASGFIGSHLRFFLYEHKNDYTVISIDEDDFENEKILREKLGQCDVIVHLAGLNRGEEEEVYKVNTSLTKNILSILDELSRKPTFIFMSSSHNTRDTAYGRSKRDSEKMISDWGNKNNTKTFSIVSPNVFGEFLKPYHNSFVGTFCHEIVEGKESTINKDAKVELIYVRDVCSIYFDLFTSESEERTKIIKGREVSIGEIYTKLKSFYDEYVSSKIIPVFSDRFDLYLFNTLRSYLYPRNFPVSLDLKTDNRGSFIEVTKERNGGQSSFSTTHPNLSIVRGNHYHTRKIERFCVISGEGIIKMRKLFSDEIIEYKVSGDKPVYVDMPTFYTHSIENSGQTELLTMFWINEIFDPKDPDTFMEPVMLGK